MPPRGRLNDLLRLFDASPDPIYVVDRDRRIALVNRACAEWTGRRADELTGRECRYQSSDPTDAVAATVDALCPPPSALAGQRVTAEIVLPSTAAEQAHHQAARRAEFVPLGVTPSGATLVVAWLPSAEIVARDETELRRTANEARRLHALLAKVRRDNAGRYASERLVGDSPAMRRVRSQIALAAGTQATVSVVGKPGSGRGAVARAVHYDRAASSSTGAPKATDVAGPLVPLDGKALDAELLQATIRGMVRTARGSACRAGTLLIGDVDRMPADAQAELAGFLRLVDLPVRIITTARRPLVRSAEAGEFRRDLAAWLSTLVIEIPPLSMRDEDIAPLAQQLLEDLNGRGAKQLGGFTSEALDRLTLYDWPGEIDELADAVAAAHEKAEGPLVGVGDLPRRLFLAADAARYAPPREETIVLDDVLAEIEREVVRRAVRRAKGNKTRAAQLLGLTRPRLYRRMVQLGLEVGPVVFEERPDEHDSTDVPDERQA